MGASPSSTHQFIHLPILRSPQLGRESYEKRVSTNGENGDDGRGEGDNVTESADGNGPPYKGGKKKENGKNEPALISKNV